MCVSVFRRIKSLAREAALSKMFCGPCQKKKERGKFFSFREEITSSLTELGVSNSRYEVSKVFPLLKKNA